SITTYHSRLCRSLFDSSEFSTFLTCSFSSTDGGVYCTPAFTPSTRRTASECPWLNPFPQKVYVFPFLNTASDITRFKENKPGSQPTDITLIFPLFWAASSTFSKCSGISA